MKIYRTSASYPDNTSALLRTLGIVVSLIFLPWFAPSLTAQHENISQDSLRSLRGYWEPQVTGLTFFFENDLLPESTGILTGTDQNYTMTFTIGLSGRAVGESPFFFPLRAVNKLVGLERILPIETRELVPIRLSMDDIRQGSYTIKGTNRLVTHGVLVGGSAFTPTDISAEHPITGDRPYSFLLFLSTNQKKLNQEEDLAISTELSAGIAGTRIGEHVQTWIHREISGSPLPKGWKHQICDGGCPTARYTLSAQKLMQQTRHYDFQVTANTSVGYQTSATAGAVMRVGLLRTPWWTVAGDMQTELSGVKTLPEEARVIASESGNRNGPFTSSYSSHPLQELEHSSNHQASPDTSQRREMFEAHLFLSGRARVVAYNMLLQGSPFTDDAVAFSSSEIERGVAEFQVGAVIGLGPVNVIASLSGRSPEFKGPYSRPHYWGGVYLAVTRPVWARK